MRLPEMNARAMLAYCNWRIEQDGAVDTDDWEHLPTTEQDAWRRAVRLITLLGLEDDA